MAPFLTENILKYRIKSILFIEIFGRHRLGLENFQHFSKIFEIFEKSRRHTLIWKKTRDFPRKKG